MNSMVEKIRKMFYMNSCISVLDNKQVLVENCKSLLECNEILVRIVAAGYIVEVWGRGLTTNNYSSGSVLVQGEIQSVSVTKRGERK